VWKREESHRTLSGDITIHIGRQILRAEEVSLYHGTCANGSPPKGGSMFPIRPRTGLLRRPKRVARSVQRLSCIVIAREFSDRV
jgi:hypothetical protein